MTTVMISGASGFIAQYLASELQKEGIRVLGISHSQSYLPHFEKVFQRSLGDPGTDIFRREKSEVLIHCAHYFGEREESVNVEGTIEWAEQAEKQGVNLQIFMSSVSARKNSPSSYARTKHQLEKWFEEWGGISLRLGLVVGKGGMFGRMTSLVKNFPILPLPDNGRNWVYLLSLQTLGNVIQDILDQGKCSRNGEVWNLFQSQPHTMREILEEIRRELRSCCWFVPVPSVLLLGLTRLGERVPFLPLKISSNNLIGLRDNVKIPFRSDLPFLGYPDKSLRELIHSCLSLSGD